MKQIPIWACIISQFLLLNSAKSDEEQVRNALLEFISKLTNSNGIPDPSSGWNSSSYPCKDEWKGIKCDNEHLHVKEIILDGFNFSGVLDARILCNVESISASLSVLNVTNNNIRGENLEDTENCFQLTQILGWNQFSGDLPKSFSQLKNLRILDVSHNEFSGPLPDLPPVQSLTVFLAQDNQFSGAIPGYNFSSLSEFNVSYNNLSGAIPDGANRFKMSSFIHNPQLCGPPLPKNCTPIVSAKESEAVPPPKPEKSGISNDKILMFAGYSLMGLAMLLIILLWLYTRGKTKKEKLDADNKVAAVDDSMTKPSFSTVDLKAEGVSKTTDFSSASAESGLVSPSLIFVTSPEVNGLRFEDLLKAPAELLGRGKHGSVYKVACQGMTLTVKRIKDWTISNSEFKQRMRRLNQVRHPNVLPAIAFYSSRQERLLVYEYQKNGSLFRLIHAPHGNQTSHSFDWSSRLSVAAATADAIAFMHEELRYDRIPHGNLKSSNILLKENMEPCISEYGLMLVDNQNQQSIVDNSILQAAEEDYNSLFKADTYAFGVILLELLTGRMVLNDGLDLASWVLAVIREEWTVEVFDRNLIREGASEGRMVNMLQIAIKCVNKSPEARPSMKQVASTITAIKDDDERSMYVSELSMSSSIIDV